MRLFGRDIETQPKQEVDLGPYEGMVGRKGDIAGPWQFTRWDMSWHRPEYFYFRSVRTGIVNRHVSIDANTLRLRPGPLANIGQHLDVPFASLRSHPDTPQALPEVHEGLWISTNPAWPEKTVDATLGKMGLTAAWEMASPDLRDEFELVPSFVEGVDPNEAESFDPTPLALSALVIYVRPSTNS